MNIRKHVIGPLWLHRVCVLLLATGWLAALGAGCTGPAWEEWEEVDAVAGPTSPVQTTGETQPHASDSYFALDHVLDIAIEIAPADWHTLRHQTRTLEDVITEIQTGCLAQPFTDIYSWFPAQVTVDGQTLTDVGIRKKGFVGSQSADKPSLKLRFDKYVNGQILDGAIERMTLNNNIQDESQINACMAYQIFADAGLPAPRCNFATVSLNGRNLGLYSHVEEIKPPFLARHFADNQGNLYEGAVSDFRPGWRGTFEKKTNEDHDDWSDIDAVVAALQDPTPSGLTALDAIVDRDRFLSFWATEVLVGHWDGYAGNRNNYHFYREPQGSFVFIPWGVDQVFSLEEDPNPFDDIRRPPPAVWAHGAIAHRLYQDDPSRTAYVRRLRELVDTVWHETELLARVDTMAAIVQQHALPAERAIATHDTKRVRQFIRERRQKILTSLEPEPPAWPWSMALPPCRNDMSTQATVDTALFDGLISGLPVTLHFTTTWGSNESNNPLVEGTLTHLQLHDTTVPDTGLAVVAGIASPDEAMGLGFTEETAILLLLGLESDGTLQGLTWMLPLTQLTSGTTLSIETGEVRGGYWAIPFGAIAPDRFTPFTTGQLELIEVNAEPGATLSVRFHGNLHPATGELPAAVDTPSTVDMATFDALASGLVTLHFTTTWGSNESDNPLAQGTITHLQLHDTTLSDTGLAVIAGPASPDEVAWLDSAEEAASLTVFGLGADHTLQGLTWVLPLAQLTGGTTLSIAAGEVRGGYWAIPNDATVPDRFIPLTTGQLELIEAGTEPGAPISVRFQGIQPPADKESAAAAVMGLVINEIAAQGEPLDWFELYNASETPVVLADFVLADDLTDTAKRVSFPKALIIPPGGYLQVELDKDGWPGFALGRDEELGIWTSNGIQVTAVNWDQGQADAGTSWARVPDGIGDFQTVDNPTPGAPNTE